MKNDERFACMIVGGGIAGLEAAITLGDMGLEVILVEKEASIGGKMILLSKVFPTLDCASCIATPKMAQAANHPRVKIMPYTDVKRVERNAQGTFRVTLNKRPTYVDFNRCTGCGQCEKVCTVGRPDQFQEGLVARKAIYIPFPQAVPKKAVIEKRGLSPCSRKCPVGLRPHAWVALLRAGKVKEAYRRALKDIPFAGTLATLCVGYCEHNCTQRKREGALPIRGLLLFAARKVLGADQPPEIAVENRLSTKVAVLDASPEALTTAYMLARAGAQVSLWGDIYKTGETFFSPHVPEWFWKKELKCLEQVGIEFKKEKPPEIEKLKQTYDLIIHLNPSAQQEQTDNAVLTLPFKAEKTEDLPVVLGKVRAWTQDLLKALEHALPFLEEAKEASSSGGERAVKDLPYSEPPVFWSLSQAQEQARRCLDCGLCCECHQCVEVCPAKAIDFSMVPQEVEVECGAILLATGFKLYDPSKRRTLGYASYPNVLTGMQLDRLLSPTRPYNWLLRPSDGKLPGNIALVLCVGSRDLTGRTRICSRICCMYSIKQAQLIMGALPIAEVTIYYIDIRAFGKGYEEFFTQAEAMGVHFVKGKVSRIEETTNNDLILFYEDLIKGGVKKARHDLVVLATGALPQTEVLKVFKGEAPALDSSSFIEEIDPYLHPGRTNIPGVFVAGAASGPKDIPDTVIHAGATVAHIVAHLKEIGWS